MLGPVLLTTTTQDPVLEELEEVDKISHLCSRNCMISDHSAWGIGCACAFAGTGALGGLDSTCIKLVSFESSS